MTYDRYGTLSLVADAKELDAASKRSWHKGRATMPYRIEIAVCH